MKLTVIGCSPAWPNPGGAHAGYLVEGPGRLLLDCGPGVLARLREREGWPRIDAIAISHLHLDHFGDLVPWVWGSLQGAGRGSPQPELLVPPGGLTLLRQLAALITGSQATFERAFRVREYEPGRVTTTGGFELLPLGVSHYDRADAFGFRITGATGVLAYSGDSAPVGALVELARDCDLFLCEATLAEPEHGVQGHMSLPEAQAAFRASGARRLLVTHRPRELGVDDGVELAREWLEIEL